MTELASGINEARESLQRVRAQFVGERDKLLDSLIVLVGQKVTLSGDVTSQRHVRVPVHHDMGCIPEYRELTTPVTVAQGEHVIPMRSQDVYIQRLEADGVWVSFAMPPVVEHLVDIETIYQLETD